MDKLPVLHKLASKPGLAAKIFKAIADPPTTSLQRLKVENTFLQWTVLLWTLREVWLEIQIVNLFDCLRWTKGFNFQKPKTSDRSNPLPASYSEKTTYDEDFARCELFIAISRFFANVTLHYPFTGSYNFDFWQLMLLKSGFSDITH